MARRPFRNGPSLFTVLENSPIEHLRLFLLQDDENFHPIRDVVISAFAAVEDEAGVRTRLKAKLDDLPAKLAERVEVECQRVLELTEAKGPTSLETVVGNVLDHETCIEFAHQPGELGKALWAHVHHRLQFDDAVSFKAIRSWRTAGRLFAGFNVDLDEKGRRFNSGEFDHDKLIAAVEKKLNTGEALTVSVVDLPKKGDYPPSVLVIVRFAGQQASVATHGKQGQRRLVYYLPQDEAILIYTPASELIEVAAERAAVRAGIAECFAGTTLGHDLSRTPLTAAVYQTHRFLKSVELPLPEITGFDVLSAEVTELEFRVDDWKARLALKAGGDAKMEDLVARYLVPGGALRRILGISRVMISTRYQRSGEPEARYLDIMISDRNASNLNSIRDPAVRNFGRKLLEAWDILRTFSDLNADEAMSFLPLMAELWDLDQSTQFGSFFADRGISIRRLEEALLIKRKEITPPLFEPEDDPTVDLPWSEDRTIYAIDLDWVAERLARALGAAIDKPSMSTKSKGLMALGSISIDELDVPCYLARRLSDRKGFDLADEALRARSALGPGIVFTSSGNCPVLIGANIVFPLSLTADGQLGAELTRSSVEQAYRAGRNLALGGGALALVGDGETARLHVPGREPLDLFGAHSVRAIGLLLKAAQAGLPGVSAGKLIAGSNSTGFQQMFNTRRWRLVETYVEQPTPRFWKLKGY